MKKLLLVIALFLCSCTALDWVMGVDEKGKDKPGTPPIEYFSELIKELGPIGTLVTGVLTIGGTAYVSSKKHKGTLNAVIEGVQKAKGDMTDDDRANLVGLLKAHIPNKYHANIRKIKDTF